MIQPVPLVEIVRSGLREGLHHGSVVMIDPDGAPLLSLGDATAPMYPRSSLKPAQAAGMLRCGLELPSADLALATASHSGEDDHVRRVGELLARYSLTEDDLRCPPDLPLGAEARRGVSVERRIAMNCSGKHAAMLATCVINGWSTADYLDPKHPLQVAIAETVVDLAGEPLANTAVDGCGAPLFAISLTGLARVFQRLVGTPVGDAMHEHPWLVAGTGREDTRLMGAVPGLISKIGAEGVFAFALPDGRAAAIKIADGADRPRLPIAVGLLSRLGVEGSGIGDLDDLAEIPVLGGGEPVGSVRLIPGALD
ncbi:asparaginase [Saccharopolyspora sp. TS4A08]|uniref:Asparaginase n=1 Tax=Saccharopolyspora ipomoeae TaxID=3042027 RepID=A0ABT6PSS5_9PSEU|nr:asparaginase [Saccharopolyspora sp. TS4A08]MDI2031068.1 asparaginase [Saccharopolyspora sp. TS4A08]